MERTQQISYSTTLNADKRNAIKSIDRLAKLMDAQFKIPGTNFRFGFDGILGFIPGIGDLSTLAVSGYMLTIMAKNGASGFVLTRMIINILIDAIIGSIPIIGDLFDIAFKANMRNLKLMKEHYQEGKHNGSALKALIPVLIILSLLVIIIIWLGYKLFSYLYYQLF